VIPATPFPVAAAKLCNKYSVNPAGSSSLSQWRKFNWHDVQPVVEILAEQSLADRAFQVSIGGGETLTSTAMGVSPPTRSNSRSCKKFTSSGPDSFTFRFLGWQRHFEP
jgi:hypothetical protein